MEYEMQWTACFFKHQAGVWDERATLAGSHGLQGAKAYAHRQSANWLSRASSAEKTFEIARMG